MYSKSVMAIFTIIMAIIIGTIGVQASDNLAGTSTSVVKPASIGSVNAKQVVGQASPLASVGTGFTYQGKLTNGGAAANGQYDLIFTLWDAPSVGAQVGSQVAMSSQSVTDGLFTVTLDFGASAFQGDARWLEIQVRQAGGGSYTILTPRQPLTPAPYAMGLMPGATINGSLSTPLFSANNSDIGNGLHGGSNSGIGVFGTSGTGFGVEGYTTNGTGVYGYTSGSGYGGYFIGTTGGVYGTSTNGYGGYFTSTVNSAVRGISAQHIGGYFSSTSDFGVAGYSTSNDGVLGSSNGNSSAGVYGQSTASSNGTGVYGIASGTNGKGVQGTSSTGDGVHGTSTSGVGVHGTSTNNDGVFGYSPNAYGVYGSSDNSVGAVGVSTSNYGVVGQSDSSAGGHFASSTGTGVEGSTSGSGNGVYGGSSTGTGVYGSGGSAGIYGTGNSYGVWGTTGGGSTALAVYGNSTGTNGNGVKGVANNGSSSYGVWGVSTSGYAGYFSGNVHVTGSCCGMAMGYSQIDHPLDPANKYLNQAMVESPDMLSVYSGNVSTDAKGEATVTLPAYLEALNGDFRYQLTIMGDQFAQARVSSKIKNNHFTIKTDKPNVEVSWLVTGIRHDPYAQQHPVAAEQDKPTNERGYYLYPQLYGQPDSKQLENTRPGAQAVPTAVSTGK